jgi:cold shock CspA family protein
VSFTLDSNLRVQIIFIFCFLRKLTQLDAKITGHVKFFDIVKGFGFIVSDQGGEDIFVHQSSVHSPGFRSLKEGELVEFDIAEDDTRGKRFAINVTGPNGEYVQGQPKPQRQFGGGGMGGGGGGGSYGGGRNYGNDQYGGGGGGQREQYGGRGGGDRYNDNEGNDQE